MSKDYFVFSPGRMKRQHNTFYFIDEDGGKKSLPIHQIDNFYLFGTLDMNTDFLQLLNKHQVAMHLFNYYGFYSGSFYPRHQKISGFTIVNQSSHYLNKDKRLFLAKQFVRSASFHMISNLRHYKNVDDVQAIIEVMKKYYNQIDEMHKISEVMGLEGTIRQNYYLIFNYFLDSNFAFDERSKRPPKDPLNALT